MKKKNIKSHVIAPPPYKSRCLKAFTLAEVLITLAIIGVVAALTIPTLISNYQKNQYVTQLKKNYNVLQNGFRQYLATQGVTKLTDTKLFTSINGEDTDSGNQSAFQTELSTIFKITKQYQAGEHKNDPDFSHSYFNVSGDEDFGMYPSFILTDGSIIFYTCYKNEYLGTHKSAVKRLNGKMTSELCYLYIDVNGSKKPNKYGRDLFEFIMDNHGMLFPYSGRDFTIFYRGSTTYTWQKRNSVSSNCETNVKSFGYGCAGRIIEEGWKMTY